MTLSECNILWHKSLKFETDNIFYAKTTAPFLHYEENQWVVMT